MNKRLVPSGAGYILALLVALGLMMSGFGDPPSLLPLHQKMDANKDGVISEAEYLAHAVALAKVELKQLDKNGDGMLQASELADAVARPEAGNPRRVFSGDDAQRQGFHKRISAGPSMRQGGQ